MKISVTWPSLLAFAALLFFLGETHELMHTGVGRLLCGGWGSRDFNVWQLCAPCATGWPWPLAATFAGPLFTFAVGWVGYGLLHPRQAAPHRSLGLALVFATLPLARALSALAGGNDEVYGLRQLLPRTVAWPLGAALVLLATVPPMFRAYAVLRSSGRPGVFWGGLLLPMVLFPAVVLGLLNPLLAAGFLNVYVLPSAPAQVTAWLAATALVLALTYRHLRILFRPA